MDLKTAINFKALGTVWWIDLPVIDFDYDTLENEILAKVTDFESKYSRFKDTSLLYRLNKNKVFKNAEPEFVDLINYGLEMYKQTDGLFNMSVAAQLERDGYGAVTTPHAVISDDLTRDVNVRLSGNVTSDSLPHQSALQGTKSPPVALANSSDSGNPKLLPVIKLSPSTTLDFGGFGKGWLVDEVAKIVRSHGINNFIVNGGGDILVGDEVQEIAIEHPTKPGYAIKKIKLKNQSLASSSSLKRTWKDKTGQTKTHIINPTGNDINNLLSVHVIADTALLADTLATVFLITDQKTRQNLSQKFHVEHLEIT